MKNFLSHIFSHPSTDPSKHVKRNFWDMLVEPVATITEASERRQARLVSALLFVITISMISGVIYMGVFASNSTVAYILAGAEIAMGIAYILSRTRYFQLGTFLSLIILSIIPILNVSLGTGHSSEALLVLLIWNILTILLSSAITSFRNTVLFVIVNISTLLLLPAFIPTVSFNNMALPLIFNGVISVTILIFTQHRNLLEKDRQLEVLRVNEQLSYSSLHDPLTDLPNRVLFMDRLARIMERAKRQKNVKFAVFFIDLDRFKVVNDSLGHDIGDLLLIESSKRLLDCIRGEDTVARLGGDEFVILLEEMKVITDYIPVADRIMHNLALPADLAGQKAFVSVSMGIVLSDSRYERPEDILRDADIAMYRAKKLGRGCYEIFDPTMLESVMTRLELEADLRRAVENQEFIVHYQPIMDLVTLRIVGFEALIRWQHPTKGLIAPTEFISITEEMGLIIPIGYWVLEQACRQIRTWQMQYPSDPPLTINVNLSPKQCTQLDLVHKISAILKKNKLEASSLKLELTESLIVEDSKSTEAILSQLRKAGIQVQIDDFGTGYSSLSQLHNLPIDTIKIDRTFISQIGKNDSGSEIVRTIMSLAHSLGMKVIAEGVETNDQLSSLKALECEYVQGFLMSKPVDNLEAGAMLDTLFGKAES